MTGPDPAAYLGSVLTGSEAELMASDLARGLRPFKALNRVQQERRARVEAACLDVVREYPGDEDAGTRALALVLRAVAAALGRDTPVVPIWTVPNNLDVTGSLTSQIVGHVRDARASIVCSTFNFQRSSSLLKALKEIGPDSGIRINVFVDTAAAYDSRLKGSRGASRAVPSYTPEELVNELPGAVVWRTRVSGGYPLRNHAKFIAIDGQKLIVTSANMSRSAERYNVELGLVAIDRLLVQQVERTLFRFRDSVYERVST